MKSLAFPTCVSSGLLVAALSFAGVAGLSAQSGHDSRVSGTIVGVLDGDRILFNRADGRTIMVHLHGIDAPELDQTDGENSKNALNKMVLNRKAQIYIDVRTSDSEISGTVFFVTNQAGSSENANIAMVQKGWAWYDIRSGVVPYDPNPPAYRNMSLRDFQAEAQRSRRGLWSRLGEPIPPWIWREKRNSAK